MRAANLHGTRVIRAQYSTSVNTPNLCCGTVSMRYPRGYLRIGRLQLENGQRLDPDLSSTATTVGDTRCLNRRFTVNLMKGNTGLPVLNVAVLLERLPVTPVPAHYNVPEYPKISIVTSSYPTFLARNQK
jgi:hypothetical protein